MNYRNLAKKHLKSAEDEIKSNSDLRLIYAALELRMAMEAITYDRALSYKDEFPPDEYKTWQPKKVMLILLEIEPTADLDCSLAIGKEHGGDKAPEMTNLGTEKVLNMKVLKNHYDAIGNYLHMPSIKQINSGYIPDLKKLRLRCEEVSTFISQVINSPIFNINFGNFSRNNCFECKSIIRKRIPNDDQVVKATCYECKATYTLYAEENNKIRWEANQQELECANNDCKQTVVVWEHEISANNHWQCNECKGTNILCLGIRYEKLGGS